MKWSTEAKVGAFALAGILLFAGILIELSSLVIFGKSGFHVTGYFKEADGIEPGNPIHYAGVEVGMVDGITVENGEAAFLSRCQGAEGCGLLHPDQQRHGRTLRVGLRRPSGTRLSCRGDEGRGQVSTGDRSGDG